MQRAFLLPWLLSALCVQVMSYTEKDAEVINTYLEKVKSQPKILPPMGDDPVKVSIGYQPQAVTDVNRNGYVETVGMLHLNWNDPRLKMGNVMRRSNIMNLSIAPDSIWTPDIELVNTFAEPVKILNQNPLVVVSQNGDVTYVPLVKIRSYCDVIGQVQLGYLNCTLKFMSWTHNGMQLDVQVGDHGLDSFTITGPWNITQMTGARNEKVYECCPEPYPDVTFAFTIRGRLYYPG